jgi:hypothetical protein
MTTTPTKDAEAARAKAERAVAKAHVAALAADAAVADVAAEHRLELAVDLVDTLEALTERARQGRNGTVIELRLPGLAPGGIPRAPFTWVDLAAIAGADRYQTVQDWARRYNGPGNLNDYGSSVAVSSDGTKVFVGPSEDPFAIDVGRIFDLIGVGGKGTDNLAGFNVHSIALQIPLSLIRKSPAQPVIGGWAAVDRMVAGKSESGTLDRRSKKARKTHEHPGRASARHWVQVERLGQPLINEVIIPRGLKDYWNSVGPDKDYQFEKYYTDQDKPGQLIHSLNGLLLNPLLTAVLGSPPAATGPTGLAQETGRADLSAILLRGFKYPNDSTPALDLTFGKSDAGKPVDELRLNTAVAATPSDKVDRRGLLCVFAGAGGFPALTNPACNPAQFDGYPNGRRLGDDVTDIEIAALIGLPIDHLIPSGIQRAYSLLALGGPNLPDTGPVGLLKFGADGVPANDANGGLFGNAFPFLNSPNAGNK